MSALWHRQTAVAYLRAMGYGAHESVAMVAQCMVGERVSTEALFAMEKAR